MPIDPKIALGAELPSREFAWTASDVQLYQLGLGAGARWTDPAELRYLDDRSVPECAELLGRTVHATEALLVRARRAFRHEYPGGDR